MQNDSTRVSSKIDSTHSTHVTCAPMTTQTWQQSLSQSLISFESLCTYLQLPHSVIENIDAAIKSFPLRASMEFLSRIEKGNARDPLLLQILPQAIEMQKTPGFSDNPLQEDHSNPLPGLLHKYLNRVLFTLTGACPVHCRYCFRRHYPYETQLPSKENWQQALQYIASHTQIDEVILSGGDPLVLKDQLLSQFVTSLEKITHVTRLRIHTRVPIMIPQRIDENLLAWMQASRFKIIVVLHCNHANEIDNAVRDGILKLRRALVTVLNQSVLLKNVNDNADVLVTLSKKLFDAGVLPYYLHLLDRVNGSAHFEVSEDAALILHAAMKEQLPGFLVPKLVREVSGQLYKDFR